MFRIGFELETGDEAAEHPKTVEVASNNQEDDDSQQKFLTAEAAYDILQKKVPFQTEELAYVDEWHNPDSVFDYTVIPEVTDVSIDDESKEAENEELELENEELELENDNASVLEKDINLVEQKQNLIESKKAEKEVEGSNLGLYIGIGVVAACTVCAGVYLMNRRKKVH